MTNISIISRKFLYAATGLAIAMVLPISAFTAADHQSTSVVAQCNDADSQSSFSMSCSPNTVPDDNDQLTEAEVAEPGFNARPGGFGDEGSHTGSDVGGGHEGFAGGNHGGGGHGR